ncbi:MAG: hypothetical protein ABJG68_10165 [Crocinitomicaceae bacterium]
MKKSLLILLLFVVSITGFGIGDAEYSQRNRAVAKTKLSHKKQDLNGHLVAHEQFVFVKYVQEEFGFTDSSLEITSGYENATYRFHAYELKDSKTLAKYRRLIGSQLYLQNYDGMSAQVVVERLVIVYDEMNEAPYLAAQINQVDFEDVYYSWVSTEESKNEFKEIELSEQDQLDKIDFANKYGYGYGCGSQISDYDYQEDYIEVKEFKGSRGESYLVVQESALAECASIVSSHLTLFKLSPNGKGEIIASGEVGLFFVSLVDYNNDGLLEVLLGYFSSAQLLQSDAKGYKELQELTWSVDGCPC